MYILIPALVIAIFIRLLVIVPTTYAMWKLHDTLQGRIVASIYTIFAPIQFLPLTIIYIIGKMR